MSEGQPVARVLIGSVTQGRSRTLEEMSKTVSDAVKELRGSDPARRAVAESQFQLCVELTVLFFSDKEAELLQRRGRAAAAA